MDLGNTFRLLIVISLFIMLLGGIFQIEWILVATRYTLVILVILVIIYLYIASND